jgi:hypothetical protein
MIASRKPRPTTKNLFRTSRYICQKIDVTDSLELGHNPELPDGPPNLPPPFWQAPTKTNEETPVEFESSNLCQTADPARFK